MKPKYPVPNPVRYANTGFNPEDPAMFDQPPTEFIWFYHRRKHRPTSWFERILFGFHPKAEIVFTPKPLTKRQRRRQKGKARG